MLAENQIEFTVIEEATKAPLSGAAIGWTRPPDRTPAEFTTDRAGKCALPLGEGTSTAFRAHVSLPGYVPRIVTWNTGNPEFQLPKEFTLPLEKARTIGGIVTDKDGKPIAGATVLLIIRASDSGRSQEIHDDIWEEKAVTDEKGRWSFDGAPSSLKYLHARLVHPEYVGSDLVGRDIAPEAYFAKAANFVMKRGHVIEGTVRDEKGTPLEGVAVLMHEHGSGSTTEPDFATDVIGRFTIANAPDETPGLLESGVLLTFFKKGFSPEMKIVATGWNPVKVDVVLPPPHRISARVVDPEGRPVAGVLVAPDYWRKVRPFRMPWLKTGADGRFAWEDAPDDFVIFDLLAEGYLPLRNVSLRTGSEPTLTLKRPVSVAATVVDADSGAPVASFQITPGVQWADGRKYFARGSFLAGGEGKFRWSFDEPVQLTGPDGTAIEDGGHLLRIRAPGYLIADSRPIRDSEDAVRLEYKLRKGEDAVIRVRTKDGAPAAGATIAVSGEGNPVMIIDGKIHDRGDALTVTTDAGGRATLPAMEGNPTLVVVHPELGFAQPTLDEARASGVALAKWGRVVVNSPAIHPGKDPLFYLNYEPLTQRSRYPLYHLRSDGKATGEGVMVFPAVKPGKVRVGIYGQPDDREIEADVPEGGEATVTMDAQDGIANIRGILSLPEGIGEIDWTKSGGSLQTHSDAKPWPAGLGIEERRKWLEETPEGRDHLKARRFYPPSIASDGSYLIMGVAPGQYRLAIAVVSGPKGGDGELLGLFQQDLTIPSLEELARQAPAEFGPNTGSVSIQLTIDPPFYRIPRAGDRLPDFAAEGMTGGRIESAALKGRKAIVGFYSAISRQFPALADDINATAAKAKAQGIEVLCVNVDDEKPTAEKMLEKHPLSSPSAWLGGEFEPAFLKTFGLVSSPAFLAVNPDGTIRGRFETAADALAALE